MLSTLPTRARRSDVPPREGARPRRPSSADLSTSQRGRLGRLRSILARPRGHDAPLPSSVRPALTPLLGDVVQYDVAPVQCVPDRRGPAHHEGRGHQPRAHRRLRAPVGRSTRIPRQAALAEDGRDAHGPPEHLLHPEQRVGLRRRPHPGSGSIAATALTWTRRCQSSSTTRSPPPS